MSVRPEDILPDGVDSVKINGVIARKGSMGAALANANILESKAIDENEKIKAKEAIKELAPALIAIGLHEHLTWKNTEIQKIFDEEISKNN